MNKVMTERGIRFREIGAILDRYEQEVGSLPDERFNCFIDIDVSKVNTKELLLADKSTFSHDMIGIFANIQRNPNEPEKSSLGMFMPRVGLRKEY